MHLPSIQYMSDFADRFWSHVNKEGDCWEWLGGKNKNHNGYGRFYLKGKMYRAHRVSWELSNKREIPKDMIVMHSCDNPSCVNPAHLSIGTHKENTQDCIKKERKASCLGVLNSSCKLTAEQVKEIRSLRGVISHRELGEKYGVSKSLIGLIQQGRRWQHI